MTKATKKAAVKVCVERCEHCGLEHYGFAPRMSRRECPRCARRLHTTRWIASPHPDTVARASRGQAE